MTNHNFKDDTIITIYDKDIPVGCGSLSPYTNSDGELSDIYMETSYQREGYLKMLLLQLETIAHSLGYKDLILDFNPSLHNTLDLFTSMGYLSNPIDDIPNIPTHQISKKLI